MKGTHIAAASGILGGIAALLVFTVQHHQSAQVSNPGNTSNITRSKTQTGSQPNGTSSGSQSTSAGKGAGQSQTSNTAGSQGQTGSAGGVSTVAAQKQKELVNVIQTMLQGNTAKKMDASGFVQYAYAKIGVKLPRTVAEQASVGTKITHRGQLQKGDIVCFNLKNSNKNLVTFDGIYMGNENFAAKTLHGLEVISLTNSYWSPKFLYAKRLL